MIEAAKVLQSAKREESIRLLELVLRDSKEWGSADDASWRQRNMAASLRNEALAIYASVDPEKALVRQKELKPLEEPSVGNSKSALNLQSDSWRAYFNDRQTAADQLVKVALPLIETEPDRALALVVQSLQGGTVSGALIEMVDLAADAINGFTDADAKSAYTDLLTIIRVNALVKQKKMIEAQQLAGSLSSEETRAWALLAVATEAAKEDKVLGFESISKALKTLDAASPSPYKTELALLAAAMLVKDDSRRAFETLVTAAKYANSAKDTSRTKPPFAFGLEAKIGEIETRLGVAPLNLSEVRIDPKLAALATTDWFRADQIVSEIREPSLRLLLRLEFAGAVLARELKSRKSQTVPNRRASN